MTPRLFALKAAGERMTTWFPLALLGVLAALTFWLDRVVQAPVNAGNGVARHDPDYIVDGLTATQLDPQGSLKHTLYARKMTHYSDDDSTQLEYPKFQSYSARQAPITVTSREALLSSKADNVYFRDDVRVTRAPFADKSEMVMQTDYLHVIPDEDIARTNQPVRITDANTVVTANGLELNNKTRILKLQGQVRGTYFEPRK